MTRVAVAQIAPALLDRDRCVERVLAAVDDAAAKGARVIAFPETVIPGYPVWCDTGAASAWDDGVAKAAYARLVDQAVDVDGGGLDPIAAAARRHGCVVVIGVHERVGESLFNAMLTLDHEGRLVRHRRKLVPTHGERLLWRPGDAHDLEPADTPYGRIGGLICWEHWMPAPRQVLHDAGEQIHVAQWPQAKEMYLLASRHYAFEGRTFVLVAAQVMRRSEVHPALPDGILPASSGDLLLDGGSAILGPDGRYLAGPARCEETILIADIDLDEIPRESCALDVAGHYARPDLFRVAVDRRRVPPRTTD